MNINAANAFSSSLSPLSSASDRATQNVGAGNSSFGSMVKGAVESLDGAQKTAEQEIARTVTGESPDLHKTIIALQTADLSFQFALQVRNKLVGAYEEIMRMQV
ncbi:MAG: flagellar hook-basal body complex protein FliE [Pyrinomonadaceae bacterium]|nr:flagellar hook-basal body complex protein FliE [Pyrinomonadaceae bacterium]